MLRVELYSLWLEGCRYVLVIFHIIVASRFVPRGFSVTFRALVLVCPEGWQAVSAPAWYVAHMRGLWQRSLADISIADTIDPHTRAHTADDAQVSQAFCQR